MPAKVFITGITGYIGGDVFYNLQTSHPDIKITALIRSKDKADQIKQKYPKVNIIIGGLDDYQIIKTQASEADIVIHTADASDHEGAARAIAEGLAEGHTKDHPGYWLHTGGTGILTWEDSKHDRLGEESDKIYNDLEGVNELVNLPDEAFHRNVDKTVLEAGEKDGDRVKTALLCPPTIYGKGRGPFNSRSRQAYELAKVILTDKYVPIIGKGKARWNQVHVADLSDLFVLLVDKALSSSSSSSSSSSTTTNDSEANEVWGAKGYYLVESGEFVWSDLARQMGKQAADLGYIPSPPQEKSLSKDAALKQAGFEAVSWGLNSRGRAGRAKKFLGWQPKKHSIQDEISNILEEEHARLAEGK